MHTDFPLLVAIVGPTAVGKTALSIQLAQAITGEIVSADSRLVYRGMDIGTAKPSATEQASVPHHLLDLINPDQEFSLSTYQTMAYQAIGAIIKRGRTPLLVGGTGQYLAALLEGWRIPAVPPQPALRAALEAEARNQGAAALHARLAALDPAAASGIDSANIRRIIRALEVYNVTGQRISDLQQRQPPPYRILTLSLERPRAELYQRIDQRIDLMIREGLLAEVFGLIRSGYDWDLPALSSLGYREFAPLWAGTHSASACIQQLKYNTHRFARKQGAWFRRLPAYHELEAHQPNLLQQALALIAIAAGPQH